MGRVFFNTRKNVQALTTTYQCLGSDSGSVFTLDSAGGAYAVTLPTVANALDGWNCKFIVSEHTPTGAITITAEGAIVHGYSEDITADIGIGTNGTAVTNLIIGTSAAKGDTIELVCDGTLWYFVQLSQVSGSVTTS
jgi:hypothetical protein